MPFLYTPWFYLVVLTVSLCGLWLCDRRWKLVAYQSSAAAKKATLQTILIGVSFFLVWDIGGIMLGVFSTNTDYTIGLNLITPNLPIEEVLFLTLLMYVSLLTVAASSRFISHRQRNKHPKSQVNRGK